MSPWRSDFPESTNPLRFFLYVIRPHWKSALVAVASVTIGAALFTSVSYIFKYIANSVTAVANGGSYTNVVIAVSAYILVLFLGQAFVRISGYAGARMATGSRATARYALTAYVTLHSRSYFSDRFAGSISNKINHASSGVRAMTEQILWQFIEFGVSVVASFVIAYFANPMLAWIFLAWVVIVLSINAYFSRKRVPLSVHAQKLETQLNGATVDLLSNITAMQEYSRRLFEIDRLKSMTENRRRAGLRNWYYGERVLVLNGILQAIFGGGMALASIHYAYVGAISPGDIILVLTLIFRMEGLLLFLGSHLNGFAETWGEIQESLEEILEPHEIPDQKGAVVLTVREASIHIEDMTFGFVSHQIFEHFNLKIEAGERIGLVGRSGAGKSTLMRLLLRHHDLIDGTIKISDTDISRVTQESLRSAISVVPQEPLLFHRTIRENISYGKPDATDTEIENAARLAQAHSFIERLPQKYATMVGERGVKLSGGERQRVAIARAIIKSSPILLLDEATSALDSESEVEIQKALRALMEGKTVIAIAHRLSTLREMDRILVMDDGRIVQEGTHEDLVKSEGIYADLWQHQAGGFLQE